MVLSDMMADMLARAMALQLLRAHSGLAPGSPSRPVTIAPVRLRRVIAFMRDQMARRLSLSELAAIGGLSASHFGRSFRAPHSYLADLRIERARELLEHTDMPVIQVGLTCGFEQPSHFATMFRHRVGVSPRAWGPSADPDRRHLGVGARLPTIRSRKSRTEPQGLGASHRQIVTHVR